MVLQVTSVRHAALTYSDISKSIFKTRRPVYLDAFNVRTLKQAGQQAALVLTLDSIGCASETRTQDASTVVELTALPASTRFGLRTSEVPDTAAAGCTGVGIGLRHWAEGPLLDWVAVDSRLCAVTSITLPSVIDDADQ
ncbi:hypothetical protein CLF_105593 [Clonorchis sinensis]|uniref:Uncharacterized protein n=1 Tax=Clonorchis sinensis TaxID=79923 RepID=G7YDS3_CLOSI|nr:hypothetical protein CLF_105593 [Clonorchis sinensis]